jgi:hypothetical protein
MELAKWIWINAEPAADEYGEFYDRFDFEKGSVQLSISADSNYAVWLNGTLVAFSQYTDYPYDKVYDTVDLTAHCRVQAYVEIYLVNLIVAFIFELNSEIFT